MSGSTGSGPDAVKLIFLLSPCLVGDIAGEWTKNSVALLA
jgi:hypothetical protein